MKMTIPFEFVEDVIPYRCRTFRREIFQAETSVEVREVAGAEAPVAIIEHDCLKDYPFIYRWFDGRLWSREAHWWYGRHELYPISTSVLVSSHEFASADRWYPSDDLETRLAAIRRWADDY